MGLFLKPMNPTDLNWDVLGHDWAARLLRRHIAQGQVRHAYLLTGPSGIGRRTLALKFAQALCCPQPLAPGMPCGTCRTCAQIARQEHPDLLVTQAETTGGILKVEQIRDLLHSLALSPYTAPYRIALLLRFQEANASAQNALLKTLEEAPEKAILLLTADSAEMLLPTIVSRCEILRLRPLGLEPLATALQQRWGLPDDEAQRLAHYSGGRTGFALWLHEHPDELARNLAWATDVPRLLNATRRERFAYAEEAAKDKDTLRHLFQSWLAYWRDLLLVSSGAVTPLVHLEFSNDLHRLAEQVDRRTAHACTARLEDALQKLDANINPRLLTEVLLLDWPFLA